MPCTTILVGKHATYDGSTMIARNSDSGSGKFTPKKKTVVLPSEIADSYESVLSHVKIELPKNPMKYTSLPNVLPKEGIWAGSGVNEANVGMTATETITTNERVLGADPMVIYHKATDGMPELPGGIGEEDLVTLVLPYIHTAREGVKRLGSLLEKYGTYEMNGIAFQDVDEIWWLESIGGHHWIAKRVPDDSYVVMPNQLGIDCFDLKDALGKQKDHMCSIDMKEFLDKNHLDLSLNGKLNPRDAFGSHSNADHVYNTPRAWFIERFLNPTSCKWDGENADYVPESDAIPWCRVPERKITVEDIKYLLSSYYQGTPYNPYGTFGDHTQQGKYRPIGINRNDFLELIQMRPDLPEEIRSLQWLTFGSNAFNAMIPFYAGLTEVPAYFGSTQALPSTDEYYWASRILGALADAHYKACISAIENYQQTVGAISWQMIHQYDEKILKNPAQAVALCNEAAKKTAAMLEEETQKTLDKVLYEASCRMKNAYSRSDS
jgi:dipeptidase